MSATAIVRVPIAGLWASVEAPRAIDSAIVADEPDHEGWLRALDSMADLDDGRRGLLGRLETELLAGEPVIVEAQSDDGWSRVRCPWQPSHKSAGGYPGLIRTAHLSMGADTSANSPSPAGVASRADLLAQARRHIGLEYLWGGISPTGLDCSGLIHFSCRQLGLIVSRDGGDQFYQDCVEVPIRDAEPGDLLFFADPGQPIHHVAIATGGDTILHAPSSGERVVEEPMPAARRDTLVLAGRLRQLQ